MFFPAACTSGKTLLGLQVCELSAESGQRVRAAGCSPSRKSGFATFSTVSTAPLPRSGAVFCPFLNQHGAAPDPGSGDLAALEKAVTDDPALAKKYASLLYDQAVLIAGFPLEDPSAYTDLVCELLMK